MSVLIAKAEADALSLLRDDHRELSASLRVAAMLAGDEGGAAAFARAYGAVMDHIRLEEDVLYPELKRRAPSRDASEAVLDGVEEHAIIRTVIDDLAKLDTKNARYEAKFSVLVDFVEHHLEHEETSLYPVARKVLGPDELDAIAQTIRRRKTGGDG